MVRRAIESKITLQWRRRWQRTALQWVSHWGLRGRDVWDTHPWIVVCPFFCAAGAQYTVSLSLLPLPVMEFFKLIGQSHAPLWLIPRLFWRITCHQKYHFWCQHLVQHLRIPKRSNRRGTFVLIFTRWKICAVFLEPLGMLWLWRLPRTKPFWIHLDVMFWIYIEIARHGTRNWE